MTDDTGGDALTPYPAPIRATRVDLPQPVVAAIGLAPAPRRSVMEAAGIPFAVAEWGSTTARPVLLLHGVTSSSATWWRMGPGLAAAGWRAVAIDLPGHGRTGSWAGRHRFEETAADVTAFARAARLARDDGGSEDPATGLAVVGHSWGSMVAAALPRAGLRPARLVLLDPPHQTVAELRALEAEGDQLPLATLEEATAAIRAANPTWIDREVTVKAAGLLEVDADAARAILSGNGDWDAGRRFLADPAADGIDAWIVRGEPGSGGYLADSALPALAELVGRRHILTVADGPHSPQRTHPEATMLALLTALGSR
jgi:pimeloyl-ACP methyl ester carboxylesterase